MSNPEAPRPQILVVEDEPAIMQLVTQILTNEDYDVTSVTDGMRAIDLLGKRPFDLVVLDVMLPVVDGFGVLKHLRTTSSSNAPRVLMLTALGRDADWLKGLRSGAHDYITKPFDHDDLIRAVERLIAMEPDNLAEHREAGLERARVLAQLENVLDSF